MLGGCATTGPLGEWSVPGSRGGRAPSRYAQSCTLNAWCSAPAASGELVLPTARVLGRVVEVARGAVVLKDFLDEAEVARVEAVLVKCAREADFQVNEREYGRGKAPGDAECGRVVGRTERGHIITRAMELGTMKHEAAFACVDRELGREFSEHLTREPRYGQHPASGEYALTDVRPDSLVPDVVLHFVRNANRIQFLYDFYFPCTAQKKSDPLGRANQTLHDKLDKYDKLPGEKRHALVTPQLGISR